MEKSWEAEDVKNKNNTHSIIVMKPLMNGCLTGQVSGLIRFWNVVLDSHVPQLFDTPHLHNIKLSNIKKLRLDMLYGATYTTASLGLFEILTKKVRTTMNDGRPLSLYQEAGCGLSSGATAALVWQPFKLASTRIPAKSFNYETLFRTVDHIAKHEGIFALWRGSGLYISTQTAANMGMLASYNRSLNYLVESKGFSKWTAVISASVVSGFFAAACSHPCAYFQSVKNVLDKRYNGGDKHAYGRFPLYMSKVVTPYGGFNFYTTFLVSFRGWAALCVVQWCILECIRQVEECMDRRL